MINKSNFTIHVVLILLSLTSLLILFSIAPDKLPQQATFLLIGFVLYLYLGSQNTGLFKNTGPILYSISILLLILTLIFGQTVRGSTRWIAFFGVQLQISELVKPLLIISYAEFLTKWKPNNFKNILKNFLIALVPIVLIFVQPDLGTALIHIAIWVAMFFIAGAPYLVVVVGALFSGLLVKLAPHFLKDYQLKRLTVFLDPSKDPLGSGYNVIQSSIAIGSGKFFGKGLGRGTQSQLRFLPERHTDFVFASLAEEFGFVGAGAVILMYLYLLAWLLNCITNTKITQNKIIFTGAFSYLFVQGFLNIAMNLGIAPVTGVTLPLISAGGSSILATYLTLGIVLALSREYKTEASIEIK